MVHLKMPLDLDALDRLTLRSTEARAAYREQRLGLEVGRTIHRARIRANLTQFQFAARADVNLDHLSRLETGQSVLEVKINVLERLAHALGHDVLIAFADPAAKSVSGRDGSAGAGD